WFRLEDIAVGNQALRANLQELPDPIWTYVRQKAARAFGQSKPTTHGLWELARQPECEMGVLRLHDARMLGLVKNERLCVMRQPQGRPFVLEIGDEKKRARAIGVLDGLEAIGGGLDLVHRLTVILAIFGYFAADIADEHADIRKAVRIGVG